MPVPSSKLGPPMENLPPLHFGNNFILTDPTPILNTTTINTTTLIDSTMNPPPVSSYSDMPQSPQVIVVMLLI